MSDHPVWQQYKARRNSMYAVIAVGTLFVLCVLAFSGNEQFHQPAFIIDAIFVFVFFMRFTCWRCPRCGKSFHTNAYAVTPFNGKCLHCGLPRYSTDFKPRA